MALIQIDTGWSGYFGDNVAKSSVWIFIWGPMEDQPGGENDLPDPDLDSIPIYGFEHLVGRY